MTSTDGALLERARAGDRAALEGLLAENEARIYRFSLSMCREPEDAGEVLQETMLALARHVGAIQGPTVSTWLYAVARSFCVKKRRRRKGAPEPGQLLPLDEAAPLPSGARDPEAALGGARLERALMGAIGALEPMYREVLLLRDVEGLSAAEVAGALGISESAVKSRLHRARARVREAIAPLQEGPAAVEGRCPDVQRLFSLQLEGEISAATCARMERHLADCPRCQATCDALKRTLALCRAAPTPEVPAEIQRSVRVALQDFLVGA